MSIGTIIFVLFILCFWAFRPIHEKQSPAMQAAILKDAERAISLAAAKENGEIWHDPYGELFFVRDEYGELELVDIRDIEIEDEIPTWLERRT